MPTYEYECTTCRYHFDAVQKMADPPLQDCPKCGKPVHRVLSGGIGILFQGSGFYVNDSHARQKSGEGKTTGEKSENPSSNIPTGEKSESAKPAAEKPVSSTPAGEKSEKPKEKKPVVT